MFGLPNDFELQANNLSNNPMLTDFRNSSCINVYGNTFVIEAGFPKFYMMQQRFVTDGATRIRFFGLQCQNGNKQPNLNAK